jgi:hypothetical protein
LRRGEVEKARRALQEAVGTEVLTARLGMEAAVFTEVLADVADLVVGAVSAVGMVTTTGEALGGAITGADMDMGTDMAVW